MVLTDTLDLLAGLDRGTIVAVHSPIRDRPRNAQPTLRFIRYASHKTCSTPSGTALYLCGDDVVLYRDKGTGFQQVTGGGDLVTAYVDATTPDQLLIGEAIVEGLKELKVDCELPYS